MAKYIHNLSGSLQIYEGTEVSDGAYLLIPEAKYAQYSNSDKVIEHLASGLSKMSDNGSTDLAGGSSDQVNFLKDLIKEVKIQEQPTFTAKTVNGKKLYTRAHGKSFSVVVGSNNLLFTIPFNEMKFNGIEIVNGKVGENVSLKVLDTVSGTVTTVPNYMLNQFGFNLNLPDGHYVRDSKYDADLFIGLQILIEYEAIEERTVYVNYLLHELKP